MKTILLMALITAASTVSFAKQSIECTSKNHTVIVEIDGRKKDANYGVNGEMNDGADVTVDGFYQSPYILTISLNIDNQPKKMALTTTVVHAGEFQGTLFTETSSMPVVEPVTCLVQTK